MSVPGLSPGALGLAAAVAAAVGLATRGPSGARLRPSRLRPSRSAARSPWAAGWRGWGRAPVGVTGSPAARPGAAARPGGTRTGRGARWATRRDLARLVVPGPGGGRLILGTVAREGGRPGRTILAVERSQSLAVVGPTQSGKTSALAVPAILDWAGPVVAASVKTDLVRDTLARRRRMGMVWCFDPAGTTGLPAAGWSPLPAAHTWAGARRVAAELTQVTRGPGTTADGEFWYATAAKLLAPLLFAASRAGLTMADVVRWVDTQEVGEVLEILESSGVPQALAAARATWQRDERQRSSVYTTAETVLEPFADPDPRGAVPGGPGGPGGPGTIDAGTLLSGCHTLYVCSPAHDQRRLQGLFGALVHQVLATAFERSAAGGAPLDPPLLVVLDEAANIAPLAELDGLAATCAGHGIQLVTVWQDLAQVYARFGPRGATVVNNHRAKLFLSGTSDPGTLDHASHLVGDQEVVEPSVTRDARGSRSVTASPVRRRLLPPDALRRMPPGTGVLVYGSLPPVRLALRPWFDDPVKPARPVPWRPAARRRGSRSRR